MEKEMNITSEVCEVCNGDLMIPVMRNGILTFRYCECYERQLKAKRLRNVGVSLENIKKIKDYKVTDDITKAAKKEAIDFITSFKDNKGEGICFLGQSGSGKTMLSLAIIKELVKTHTVIYLPYLNSMMELRNNMFNAEFINKTMSKYINCDLLIIDDLFKDILVSENKTNISRADIKFIYDIINYRYIANKPIIVNSEADPKTLIDIDEALAGRLLERNSIIVFKGKKYNYRLKDFI